jgi:hypothetical protein
MNEAKDCSHGWFSIHKDLPLYFLEPIFLTNVHMFCVTSPVCPSTSVPVLGKDDGQAVVILANWVMDIIVTNKPSWSPGNHGSSISKSKIKVNNYS